MATLIRHRWTSSFEAMSRRDHQGCNDVAYLPDPLAGWHLPLSADLVADLTDDEAAIRRLNTSTTSHVSLEGLARFLLRSESVASSKIEGLEAGPRRLLDAEVVLAQGGDTADRIAVEALANVAAMEAAVALGSTNDAITLDHLLAIHRILMERSSMPHIGGVVRTTQNWIGGSSYNPCSAAFVPPPPESLDALLNDLLDYVNGDHHPALVQAAIAHRNSFLTACPSISAPTNDPAWRTPSMVSTVHRCLANGHIGIAHTLDVADVRPRVRRVSGGSLAAMT